MEIISKAECQKWLRSSFTGDLTLEEIWTQYPQRIMYELPTDTGAKTALARAVLNETINADRPGLLWITGWSVFPSCENRAIFYGYRKSLGEARELIDAPGHIFGASDLQEIECLFGLSLYFYWDASIFDGSGDLVVRCCNDEWVSVHAKSEARLRQAAQTLEPYELVELAQG